MLPRSLILGLSLTTLSLVSLAQQATEMYIPIGASPGVSGRFTLIGTIANAETRTITVGDAGSTTMVTIPETSPIWLDRTKGKGPNQVGSLTDLKTGRTVEVKYVEPERAPALTAEWVKIGIPD